MSTEAPQAAALSGEEGRKPSSRPYWLGLLIMAMGALWLHGASGLPQASRYAVIGPGFVVGAVGAALVLLGAILLVQIRLGESFEPQEAEDAEAGAVMDKRAFLTALLAVSLPVLTMGPLGMPFTATVSFLLVARAFGSRAWKTDLLAGALLAGVSWALFTRLGVQLGAFFPPLTGG